MIINIRFSCAVYFEKMLFLNAYVYHGEIQFSIYISTMLIKADSYSISSAFRLTGITYALLHALL